MHFYFANSSLERRGKNDYNKKMKHLILSYINKERSTYQAKSFECSSLIDCIFHYFRSHHNTKQQHRRLKAIETRRLKQFHRDKRWKTANTYLTLRLRHSMGHTALLECRLRENVANGPWRWLFRARRQMRPLSSLSLCLTETRGAAICAKRKCVLYRRCVLHRYGYVRPFF